MARDRAAAHPFSLFLEDCTFPKVVIVCIWKLRAWLICISLMSNSGHSIQYLSKLFHSITFFFFFFWPFQCCIHAIQRFPGNGAESERQLLTYTTATAMQDPSHICDLCHSSWQCQTFNPLRRPGIKTATSWIQVGSLTAEPQQELHYSITYNVVGLEGGKKCPITNLESTFKTGSLSIPKAIVCIY